MRCGRGFTLTELLMVVVLLAILARMALPQYAKTIDRQRYQTAKDVLQTIYAGEKVYFSQNDAYYFSADGRLQAGEDWSPIFMDDPNAASNGVEYEVWKIGPGRARAVRAWTDASKSMAKTVLDLIFNGTFTGTWSP